MNNIFTEEMLARLRESVKNEMGEKRYNHTLEVEKMAICLGEIYAPSSIRPIRAGLASLPSQIRIWAAKQMTPMATDHRRALKFELFGMLFLFCIFNLRSKYV